MSTLSPEQINSPENYRDQRPPTVPELNRVSTIGGALKNIEQTLDWLDKIVTTAPTVAPENTRGSNMQASLNPEAAKTSFNEIIQANFSDDEQKVLKNVANKTENSTSNDELTGEDLARLAVEEAF